MLQLLQIFKKPPKICNECCSLIWHLELVTIGRKRIWVHQCKHITYLRLCKRPANSRYLIQKGYPGELYNMWQCYKEQTFYSYCSISPQSRNLKSLLTYSSTTFSAICVMSLSLFSTVSSFIYGSQHLALWHIAMHNNCWMTSKHDKSSAVLVFSAVIHFTHRRHSEI